MKGAAITVYIDGKRKTLPIAAARRLYRDLQDIFGEPRPAPSLSPLPLPAPVPREQPRSPWGQPRPPWEPIVTCEGRA